MRASTTSSPEYLLMVALMVIDPFEICAEYSAGYGSYEGF